MNRIGERRPDANGWLARVPQSVPASLRGWLNETGSLTRRVKSVCTSMKPFSLHLLAHGFAAAHRDERLLLAPPDVHGRTRVRMREVVLQRGEQALVFAHSVISHRDMQGAWAILDGIGARSLGSILFHDHTVSRGALYFRRIDSRHPLFAKALPWCGATCPIELWARRAVFKRAGRPLIVTEVFLPAVLDR